MRCSLIHVVGTYIALRPNIYGNPSCCSRPPASIPRRCEPFRGSGSGHVAIEQPRGHHTWPYFDVEIQCGLICPFPPKQNGGAANVLRSVCFIITILTKPSQSLAQIVSDKEPLDIDMRAKATFEIASWDEEPFSPVEAGDKLTRVSVVKSYSGEIDGEGRLEYLMRYHGDGSAEFYGLERIIGSVKGVSGSFILRHTGTFQGGEMTQTSTVLPGSGTEALAGLSGKIQHTAGHQQTYPFEFEYTQE